jgi:hypothetical protein
MKTHLTMLLLNVAFIFLNTENTKDTERFVCSVSFVFEKKGKRIYPMYLILSITFLMRQLQINQIHPFLL